MEDFIKLAHILFRGITGIASEVVFLKIFVYVGIAPIWLLSLGRIPKKKVAQMSYRQRIFFGLFGFIITIVLGVLAATSDTFHPLSF